MVIDKPVNKEGGKRLKEIEKNYSLFKAEAIDLDSQWNPCYSPNVKMIKFGEQSLSDKELFSIIFRHDINDEEEELFIELLSTKNLNFNDAIRTRNIDFSSTVMLIALHELRKRYFIENKRRMLSPDIIFNEIKHFASEKKELFLAISIGSMRDILGVHVICIGSSNRVLIQPREIFCDIIEDRAAAFCVAHNHPSGILHPSSDDEELTKNIKHASSLLGVSMLDHIIFSKTDYYSYAKDKRLKDL